MASVQGCALPNAADMLHHPLSSENMQGMAYWPRHQYPLRTYGVVYRCRIVELSGDSSAIKNRYRYYPANKSITVWITWNVTLYGLQTTDAVTMGS
jgi:hypothetical protein